MKSVAMAGIVGLAACAPTLPPVEPAVPGTRCDANAAAGLAGKSADTAVAEAKRLSGAESVRRYVTGSPVTMDYRADRLNVETDAAGVIVKLTCG